MVIDQDGNQLGVMSSYEALDKAYEADLDLLCVISSSHGNTSTALFCCGGIVT